MKLQNDYDEIANLYQQLDEDVGAKAKFKSEEQVMTLFFNAARAHHGMSVTKLSVKGLGDILSKRWKEMYNSPEEHEHGGNYETGRDSNWDVASGGVKNFFSGIKKGWDKNNASSGATPPATPPPTK